MVNVHLHIFIEAAKDLEPTHCHALCSSKRETGGLAMQSEGEHHSPETGSFSYRFLLLARKGLDATVCVWSIEYKASLSNPNMLGSMLVYFRHFIPWHIIWDTMWIFQASTASSRSALGFWCNELRHNARPTPKHGTRPAWRKVNDQRC